MSRESPLPALLLASAVALLPVLSCYSDRSEVTDPIAEDCRIPGSAIGPNRAVVLIRDFAFFPDTLRIRPGTRVTWVNCEPATIDAHTSTSTGNWDSGFLSPGDSFARDFPTPGSTPYFCIPHSFMQGAVIVQ